MGISGTSPSTAKELAQMNLFDLPDDSPESLDVRDNCNKSLGSTQLRIYTPKPGRPPKTGPPPRAQKSAHLERHVERHL